MKNSFSICPYFGPCGGCEYQHLSYPEELNLKQEKLKLLFQTQFPKTSFVFEKLIASPKIYRYRHRIDLGLRRSKEGELVLGFVSKNPKRLMNVEDCLIAREEISDFIPHLKEELKEKFPKDYRVASLVLKTDDASKLAWGGIGKGSLKLEPSSYFYSVVNGRKIFYSLDNFFQANLSILEPLYQKLNALFELKEDFVFLDLYGGVGLFSVLFSEQVKKNYLVENCLPSIRLAEFNQNFHQFKNWEIIAKPVEEVLAEILEKESSSSVVAMIDPPRKGLHQAAADCLAKSSLSKLYYLSCNPESLIQDLKIFLSQGWGVERILPFDFFPRTVHLEVLVVLKRN